jgi:hypothetical protein
MFYANFKYKNLPEITNIRFYFEQKRKNETFRSQKNETLTSLVLGPVPIPVPVQAPLPAQVPVPDGPPLRINENNALEITNRAIDLNNYGQYESNRETDKFEAFADDNTVLALLDEPALINIKKILQDFGTISGLKCNVDKSVIMLIGREDHQQVQDFVINSGFAVVDNVKILGVKFTKNAEDITQNFDNCIEKIRKTANFWTRFKLSLIGQINIAKTLMLSQLGYLGTIFTPNELQIL